MEGSEISSLNLDYLVPDKWDFQLCNKKKYQRKFSETINLFMEFQNKSDRKTSFFFIKQVIEKTIEFLLDPLSLIPTDVFYDKSANIPFILNNIPQLEKISKGKKNFRL